MTKVALAGGGTAGHTSPMLATARALTEMGEMDIICIGTPKGLETTLVPEAGFELQLVDPVPLPRELSLDLVKLPFRLVKAFFQARKVLRDHGSQVVIGFGGYVCVPTYVAAASLRIPIAVHEANAMPGIANRIGAKFAGFVATTFPAGKLPGAKMIGMPVASRISHPEISRSQARDFFELRQDLPTLLVSGGSQGAKTLNDAIDGAKDRLLAEGIQVLHILGKKNFSDQERVVNDVTGAIYQPVAFVDDMANAYLAADLMFARAGAGTVVETAMNGLPAIYVPFPHGNGEQWRNAEGVVNAGGGILIDDADVNAERLLAEVLPRINDADLLAKMSAASSGQSPKDADRVLAQAALDLIK